MRAHTLLTPDFLVFEAHQTVDVAFEVLLQESHSGFALLAVGALVSLSSILLVIGSRRCREL